MSLSGATGLIGTAIGLGVLVGVAGLAFQAVERTFPDNRGKGRNSRRRSNDGLFGGSSDLIGGRSNRGSRSRQNIFDLGLTQSSPTRTRKKKFSQDFGSDFNIFAV
jgi:hypothetical protein